MPDKMNSATMRLGCAALMGMLCLGLGAQEAAKHVRYSDFGAKGDGKADDQAAIVKAHEYANEHNLPVRADDNATYYIGSGAAIAVIKTDTDFGTAKFTIDDRKVDNLKAPIFHVGTSMAFPDSAKIMSELKSVKRGQANLGVKLPCDCLVVLSDSTRKMYIRYGANQNNGSSMRDLLLVDKDGNISADTPVIWNFDTITGVNAYPVDSKALTVKGGIFTTIANQAESKYTYYGRGFNVRRSNVVMEKMKHLVTGEGDHGAPYSAFIGISNCVNVIVRDTVLTGHKTYRTIGSAKTPVSMGTYDINANTAANISFINVTQTNDINDTRYWGILGTNYCKNLLYDNCVLSRFDAHQGVANATIRNSTLGHNGASIIGFGTFTMENTTSHGASLFSLRSDYGSTWEGDIVIRNCTFVPRNHGWTAIALISGSYSGKHNFGYTSYFGRKILIENLLIKDGKMGEKYTGLVVFSNFNGAFKDDAFQETFPAVRPEEVIVRNLKTESGKTMRLSANEAFFKDVKFTVE